MKAEMIAAVSAFRRRIRDRHHPGSEPHRGHCEEIATLAEGIAEDVMRRFTAHHTRVSMPFSAWQDLRAEIENQAARALYEIAYPDPAMTTASPPLAIQPLPFRQDDALAQAAQAQMMERER